ncbi:MAG: nucleotide pyrophosphohydrolase [bacterium]|nr:nucleotide pyrophosphohydrolase [bacterium]
MPPDDANNSGQASADGEDLGLRAAQQEVDAWIRSTGKGYFSELTNLARLLEETGELARIYSRTRGELKAKPGEDVSDAALQEEMGDVLFVLMCLANQADIDLGAALNQVLAKFRKRDGKRHQQ